MYDYRNKVIEFYEQKKNRLSTHAKQWLFILQ